MNKCAVYTVKHFQTNLSKKKKPLWRMRENKYTQRAFALQ